MKKIRGKKGLKKEKVLKKGFPKEFVFGIMVLLVALFGFLVYNFFSYDSDSIFPEGSEFITGNAINIRDGSPLTLDELRAGVPLSGDTGDQYRFTWTDELTEDVLVEEAWGSILDHSLYFFNFDDWTYWFNPNGYYAWLIDDPSYQDRQFTHVLPGNRYRAVMFEDSVLRYPFSSTFVTLENGSVVAIEGCDRFCFDSDGSFLVGDEC